MTTTKLQELCWRCGGFKTVAVDPEESQIERKQCPHCKGTGYGESFQTMRARKEREEKANAKTG